MFKNKKLWLIVALSIIAAAALGFVSKTVVDNYKTVFVEEGYVLSATPNAESEKIYFNKDVKYSNSYNDEVTFNDINNNKRSVAQDSFFHYNGDYVSTMVPGVFMDLAETGAQFITHYQTEAGAIFSNESKFTIKSSGNEYKYDEVLWKLNDDRYIILAKNLKAIFSEEDVRPCGSFAELHYLDRGVVQIITEENIWQTASSDCYLETESGIRIYPINEEIYNPELDRSSFMNALVVDSDDNMHLRSDQEDQQIIPKFNVNTEDGKSGESGEKGESGPWGADAGTTSSSKTSIPTMNIVQWEVGPNELYGGVLVNDENGVLLEDSNEFQVYIVEKGGSNPIPVYPAYYDEELKKYSQIPDGTFEFNDGETVYFTTGEEASEKLKPDTEYMFYIRGKYTMGSYSVDEENTSNINRDLVFRSFFTDSLGIALNHVSISSNSIVVSATKNDYSIAQQATVFLLTEGQNLAFNEEIAKDEMLNGGRGYPKATLNFGPTDETTQEIQFGGILEDGTPSPYTIDPDTNYVVRVVTTYVSDSTPLQDLSKQELKEKTLKRIPTATGYPTVASNRQQKMFEIYGATISDPDNSINLYRFEVYENGTGRKVKTVDVDAINYEKMDYVSLYIDDQDVCFNRAYYVVESVIYNDNEKEVQLQTNEDGLIMQSSIFTLYGAALPSVTFRYQENGDGEVIGRNYERLQGWIVINKNNADVKVDAAHPIVIAMEAEGVFSKTTSYTSGDVTDNGTEILIYIDQMYLNQDKIYRFAVSAYIDVDDDNDTSTSIYNQTLLGEVVASTTKAPTLYANWLSSGATSHAISRTVKLQAANPTEDISYLQNTLSQITFELYSGTAASGKRVGAPYLLADEDTNEYISTIKKDLFTDGIELSEATFNISSSALDSSSYEFKIVTAYDYTVVKAVDGNINGYVNNIEITNATSGPVGRTQQPPALPTYGTEDTSVSVVAITKKQAQDRYGLNSFGGNEIPDNTIVGYSLLSQYDDFGKLARTVVYYGFEASYFLDKVNNKVSPENDTTQNCLFQVELPVDLVKGVIPSLVVWFGASEDVTTKEVFEVNGQKMLYAGVPQVADGVTSTGLETKLLSAGMGRGFKYIFSYRMNYSSNGDASADKVYPINHPDYEAWNLGHNGVPALSLHSKVQSAPKVMPNFQSIPMTAQGTELTIKYRYEDVDNVVTFTTKDDIVNNSTMIINGTTKTDNHINIASCRLADVNIANSCPWELTTIQNISSIKKEGSEIDTVTISVDSNPYVIDYSQDPYLAKDYKNENTEVIIFETPWFRNIVGYDSSLIIRMNATNEVTNTNRILVSVIDENGANNLNKLVGAILTFTPVDGQLTDEEIAAGKVLPEPKDIFVGIDTSPGSGNIGVLNTSSLTEFLGLELTVSAELYYDTDVFGWGDYVEVESATGTGSHYEWVDIIASDASTLSDQQPYVALQESSLKDGFGKYITKSLNAASALKNDIANNSFFKLYYEIYNITGTAHISVRSLFYGVSTVIGAYDVAYNTRGVIYEKNTSTAIVAKRLSEVALAGPEKILVIKTGTDETDDRVKINTIIPSAKFSTISPKLTSAVFNNFTVQGFEQIRPSYGKRYITVKLYEQVSDTKKEFVKSYSWLVTADGTLSKDVAMFNDLKEDKNYYVEFYVNINDPEADSGYRSVRVINMSSTSNEPLTGSFSTKSNVDITGLAMNYSSLSYASKYYNLSYRISQTTDINIKYYIDHLEGEEDWVNVLTHEQMVAKNIITEHEGSTYTESIKDIFNFTPGNHPLIPGQLYRIRIVIYSTELTDEDGKPKVVSDEAMSSQEFRYPATVQPSAYINTTPLYEEYIDEISGDITKDYGFSFDLSSIGDSSSIIMNSNESGREYGTFTLRLFQTIAGAGGSTSQVMLKDSPGIVVTSSNGQINSLEDLYSGLFLVNSGLPKITIWGLNPSTNYSFTVYAANDSNLNNKVDTMEGVENKYIKEDPDRINYSIYDVLNDPVTRNYFDNYPDFRNYYKLSEKVVTTPDENGINIGTVRAQTAPGDSERLQFVFFNSSNLDNIDRAVLSVNHTSGSPYLSPSDGTYDKSQLGNYLKEGEGGRWTMTIGTDQIALTKSGEGYYSITLNLYIGDKLVYSLSDIVEK